MNQPDRTLTNDARGDFGHGADLFRDPANAGTNELFDLAGLGPTFVNVSCVACHVDGLNAGSPVPKGAEPKGMPEPGMIVRLSGGNGAHGEVLPDPNYGMEIQDTAVPGATPEAEIAVTWIRKTITYPDGTELKLRRPKVELRDPTADAALSPSPKIQSPRVAVPLVGLGLLASIPEANLKAASDPNDTNHDGISGEVQMVWDATAQRYVPGRFGWKALQPTVAGQTGGAAALDMGVTNPVVRTDCDATPCPAKSHPATNPPEVNQTRFDQIVIYTEAIAVPESRPLRSPTQQMADGAKAFADIGCSACHTPAQTSGPSHIPGWVPGQTFYPYTDLLLHDMGPDSADGRTEFNASSTEWRTPPLWGQWIRRKIGFGRLMHDGRAGSVEEAIAWHGGEGSAAASAFAALPEAKRAAVIAFVESL